MDEEQLERDRRIRNAVDAFADDVGGVPRFKSLRMLHEAYNSIAEMCGEAGLTHERQVSKALSHCSFPLVRKRKLYDATALLFMLPITERCCWARTDLA